jgi:polyvinyl alcohol dehydrogenase (cytochrome)
MRSTAISFLPGRALLSALGVQALLAAGCGSGASPSENAGNTAQTLSLAPLECAPTGDSWPSFGRDLCNSRSVQGVGAINPATASKLAVKWKYQAGGDISATPAVLGNELFVPDWGGHLNKVDARTGAGIWSVSISQLLGAGDAGLGAGDVPPNYVSRGTPAISGDSVIIGVSRGDLGTPQPQAIVLAVSRTTGALQWQTTVDSHITAQVTSSPIVVGNRVYVGVASFEEFWAALPLIAPGAPNYPCCSFRGSVVALDANTGAQIWKTYTIEDSAYFQSDGMTPSGFAGAAVWAAPTVDLVRGALYVTTGNNYSAPDGTTALPAGDHVESIMSLDMKTGAIRWSQRMTMGDVWNLYYYLVDGPTSGGPDYDFGSSANLFSAKIHGVRQDVVGAGQKSGVYWALDPDTGNVLWNTAVGPGGHLGGIHWGTAVDGQRIYTGVNNEFGSQNPYVLGGSGSQAGQSTTVGSWAALDPATGAIQWQVANPAMSAPINGSSVNGPVSTVNGVVFGGSMDTQGTMFAFDAATGNVLWSFQSGATVYGGPAIADGVVYWGNGYPSQRLRFGTPGGTLYAFAVAP